MRFRSYDTYALGKPVRVGYVDDITITITSTNTVAITVTITNVPVRVGYVDDITITIAITNNVSITVTLTNIPVRAGHAPFLAASVFCQVLSCSSYCTYPDPQRSTPHPKAHALKPTP